MRPTLREWTRLFRKSFKSWIRHEPFHESAVIAYFAIFSIPALLVLILNTASIFIDREKLNQELSRQVKTSISPATAHQIDKAVEQAGKMDGGFVSTALGILIILFGATRVFIHLKKTLNRIWEIPKKPIPVKRALVDSLFSIGLILSIGFLLLASMVITTALAAAGHWLQNYFVKEIIYLLHLVELLLSTCLIGLLFALMFRYLPDERTSWRSVIPGSIVTAVLFTALQFALAQYFGKAEPKSMYGAAGSIVLLMLWIAIASMVVFFGAEFTRQYMLFRKEHPDKKE